MTSEKFVIDLFSIVVVIAMRDMGDLFELYNVIWIVKYYSSIFFLLLYDFFIFIKRLVFIVEFVTNMKNESRKLSIEERKNCRKL